MPRKHQFPGKFMSIASRPVGVLLWATVIVPLVLLVRFLLPAPPLVIFALGGVAVAVLAEWMRRATEQLALRAGPSIGGLLNVSFGSAAELILMLFVIWAGHADVVRAQITGSIMGTSLLGLGLACLVGGWARDRQTFSKDRVGLLSSLLLIVFFALVLPAVFDHSELRQGVGAIGRGVSEETLSLAVSVVLLLLYSGNLVFTLITHRDVFAGAASPGEKPRWSTPKSLAILAAATTGVAICADLVSEVLSASAKALHVPPLFLGVVPLALIGTAADLFASVIFARQNRMNLVMSISLGSAIQVGLVVAPMLVLISWAMGKPMSLVFPSTLDLFAIGGTAFIVNAISTDGETNWFEGVLLIGMYALLALAFLFISQG
jgi:Ca2+:H+ antiporter